MRDRTLRRSSANRGFSLTELLVVVALLALIALFAAPNMQRFYQTYKLANASRDVASMAQLARMKAVARNARIDFKVDASARLILVYGPKPPTGGPPVEESVRIPKDMTIDTGTTTITFLPNGTASFTAKCTDVRVKNIKGTIKWVKVLVSGVVRTTDSDEPSCS